MILLNDNINIQNYTLVFI